MTRSTSRKASSSERSEDAVEDRASMQRHDRQRFRRRRQARGRKAKPAGRGRGRRDLAELLLTNIQGNAAIANPMRVTAFETPAIVSEQQCAGIEQPVAGVRAIGEASVDDGRDAEPVVPLLERTIGRPGAADDLAHAPAVSGRQRSLGERLVRRRGRAWADGLDVRLAWAENSNFPQAVKRQRV